MDSLSLDIIIIIVSVFLSAYFSGSETALFSLKKSDLHRFSQSTHKRELHISRIMEKPQRILTTILIGNLFVNIILSALSTRIMLYWWADYGHLIAISIVTPLLVVFCEISPKVISINNYEAISKRVIPLLAIIHTLLLPLRVLLLAFNNILKIFSFSFEEEDTITEEELDMAIKLGEAEGVIGKGEEVFIKNVLRFSKKEASNVMIPRNKAVFIPYNSDIKTAVKIFMENSVVRAPVFKGNLDNVIGMLDSRELIPHVMGYKNAKLINRFIHDIEHYPASKELGDLLSDFLNKKIQIAIVVDEYGGTEGVVTLKSILSELMGKKFITSEEERKDEQEIKEIDSKTFVISGDMQIDDFNFNFNENINNAESDTIGGYIIERLGHFPKRSETISIEKFTLRVRHIIKNRIETIELRKK